MSRIICAVLTIPFGIIGLMFLAIIFGVSDEISWRSARVALGILLTIGGLWGVGNSLWHAMKSKNLKLD